MVERSPVDANAHGLLIFNRDFDHGAEVGVVLAANADVSGINAVFGKGTGAGGVFLKQDVSVVVEVADDRDMDSPLIELLNDVRNGGGGVFVVDCNPN